MFIRSERTLVSQDHIVAIVQKSDHLGTYCSVYFVGGTEVTMSGDLDDVMDRLHLTLPPRVPVNLT